MRVRSLLAAITTVLSLAAGNLPLLAQGGNPNPRVLPVNSSPHGLTYGEWSARWWQWFFSLPAAQHPVFGGDCSSGQLGKVWFLAGLFQVPAAKECSIPTGTMLFFPIINAECSNRESPPFFGVNEAERRTCAKAFVDQVDPLSLSVIIDGTPLQNLTTYRVQSPQFMFTVADSLGPLIGVPPGSGDSVGDGYYLMLNPLTPGTHTVRFTGSAPPVAFAIDTTYVLTVRH